MSTIKGKTLFFTTSPRTPLNMLSEIKLLVEKFTGKAWNTQTQISYMEALVNQDFYRGSKNLKDPALSARDRITRSPKALGFVNLKPTISITPAGKAFLESRHKQEPLLRQLLKFQLPSPFHTDPKKESSDFWVKPYLEIIRLVRHFGILSFHEVQLFGMQLTNYHKFDVVVKKIETFRENRATCKIPYKKFLAEYSEKVIREIYSEEFASGVFSTRESRDKSAKKFIDTKKSNLRDYTDACFRYLRATDIINISQSGHSISIMPEKTRAVDYILRTVSREPTFVDDRKNYKKYLFDSEIPKLYSDNIENLKRIVKSLDPAAKCEQLSLIELKDLQYDLIDQKKKNILSKQADEIKNYKDFDDIIDTFDKIPKRDSYYDRPLMFEWNTWRAMTILDGGIIHTNLNFDDLGKPLSTAPGNLADIICDYGDFFLNVEVTLQKGQKQYDNEGEPVARHVGKTKEATGKPTYCFFIAPKINEATVAYFFTLQRTPIRLYGGKANIIPLELDVFKKMLLDSKKSSYVPEPVHIRKLADKVQRLSFDANDEVDWYEKTKNVALRWLEGD